MSLNTTQRASPWHFRCLATVIWRTFCHQCFLWIAVLKIKADNLLTFSIRLNFRLLLQRSQKNTYQLKSSPRTDWKKLVKLWCYATAPKNVEIQSISGSKVSKVEVPFHDILMKENSYFQLQVRFKHLLIQESICYEGQGDPQFTSELNEISKTPSLVNK